MPSVFYWSTIFQNGTSLYPAFTNVLLKLYIITLVQICTTNNNKNNNINKYRPNKIQAFKYRGIGASLQVSTRNKKIKLLVIQSRWNE